MNLLIEECLWNFFSNKPAYYYQRRKLKMQRFQWAHLEICICEMHSFIAKTSFPQSNEQHFTGCGCSCFFNNIYGQIFIIFSIWCESFYIEPYIQSPTSTEVGTNRAEVRAPLLTQSVSAVISLFSCCFHQKKNSPLWSRVFPARNQTTIEVPDFFWEMVHSSYKSLLVNSENLIAVVVCGQTQSLGLDH